MDHVVCPFYGAMITADLHNVEAVLCPLACFLSGLIWNCGSYRTPWTGGQPSHNSATYTGHHTRKKKRGQTSMTRAEFKLIIRMFERVKTVHAVNRAATVIGGSSIKNHELSTHNRA
jgi:hypothetical protein